jgi:hypothetical protein
MFNFSKRKKPQTDTEEFLSLMRDRFTAAESGESEIRAEATKDMAYVAGDQWDPRLKKKREDEDRPALVFNHLPTYVQQVSNEARQNKAQVKFGPVDSGSDIDTAKVLEGMARAIQRKSRADIAYETAVDCSAACSFGHYTMTTDYCDYDGFDLEIKFVPVYDPFSVYGTIIPACYGKKPQFAIVLESMSRDEFKHQYPDSELVSIGFDAGAKMAEGWITEDVRIAEYWRVESKKRIFRRATMPDGTRQKVFTDDLEKDEAKYAGAQFVLGSDGLPREREVDHPTIKSCLTNGVEILPGSETTWLGRRIPVYTVLGRQLIVGGKPRVFSLVRFMRDPQQLLNIYKSGIAENIGLANRVPYIGYKGQFRDPKWRNANIKNYAYLEAEPVMAGGAIAPLPSRQNFEPAIQALSAAAAQEIDDLKSIAGIYDASLGAQGNETSGIAIERRNRQSGLTNFHFIDNLTRVQMESGDELGYLIPRIYDAEREVKTIGDDEKEKVVKVNAPYTDEKGEQHSYLLDAGQYDVTVIVGATTESQRKEAAEQTGQVIQAAPELMAVIGDILFRNSDNPAAAETAERLKKWINLRQPGLIEDDQKQQIPPAIQAKLEQSGQVIEQLTQQVQLLNEEMKTKKLELESRERIEAGKLEFAKQELDAQMELEMAKLGSQEAVVQLREELNILRAQWQQQGDSQQLERQAEIDEASQMRDQAHQVQQQDVGHQQGMEAAAQGAQHGMVAEQQRADIAQQQAEAEPDEELPAAA